MSISYKVITDEELISRLRIPYYKPGKVQKLLMEFHESDNKVIQISIDPNEYKGGIRSA